MDSNASIVGYVVLIVLFMTGFWYVSDVSPSLDMGVETNVTETETFSERADWLNSSVTSGYSGNCETTDDGKLSVSRNDRCEWNSTRYNTSEYPEATPLFFDYVSDWNNGDVNLTVRTYNSSGVINQSSSYDLVNDSYTERLSSDFENKSVDSVQVQLVLDDNGKPDIPTVSEYDLDVQTDRYTDTRGLDNEDAEILTMIVFLVAGVLVAGQYLG